MQHAVVHALVGQDCGLTGARLAVGLQVGLMTSYGGEAQDVGPSTCPGAVEARTVAVAVVAAGAPVRPSTRETQTTSQLPPRRYFAVCLLDSGTRRPCIFRRPLPALYHVPCTMSARLSRSV